MFVNVNPRLVNHDNVIIKTVPYPIKQPRGLLIRDCHYMTFTCTHIRIYPDIFYQVYPWVLVRLIFISSRQGIVQGQLSITLFRSWFTSLRVNFQSISSNPALQPNSWFWGFEGSVPSLGFRKQTMHHSQTQRVFYPTVTRDLNPRAGIQHDTTPSKSIKKHQKGMLWRFITGVLHVNNRPLERNSQQQHTGAKSPCPVRSK